MASDPFELVEMVRKRWQALYDVIIEAAQMEPPPNLNAHERHGWSRMQLHLLNKANEAYQSMSTTT